jgi:hypothetical protein
MHSLVFPFIFCFLLLGCSSNDFGRPAGGNHYGRPSYQSFAPQTYDQPIDAFMQGVAIGMQANRAPQMPLNQSPNYAVSRVQPASESGHWIKKNIDGGAMILLENGMIWGVEPFNKFETSLWLPIDSITIVESSDGMPGYTHVLINGDAGEKAHVKYLGNE